MSNTRKESKNELPDRLPPQNIEAEQSVLGCLLIDTNAIIKVADFLKPRDFYRLSHKMIYEVIMDLFSKTEPIDFLSVSSRLKEKNQFEEIGGTTYLTTLANVVPTASHALSYAKIVQRKKVLRDLIEASHDIGLLGYNEDEDVDTLLDQAENRIFGISQHSISQNFLHVKDTLSDAFNRIDQLSKHEGDLRGLRTGFTQLDNILAGLQKADLIILAARPSIGKSALAVDIARNVALQEKVPVGLFSLEMSQDQVVDRLLSAHSNVDLWKIRTGRLSSDGEENDFTRIQHTLGVLSEAPLFIDHSPTVNMNQMRSMTRRLQAEHGLGLIVVDYLQLIQPRNPNDNEVQQITEISRSLKALARELNVPILALSQLSRAVEQRSPQIPRLSDLRQSGSIEQDSDVVLFIYREDRDKKDSPRKNIADIIIAKHRNGPVGKIELYFDEQRVTYRNIETYRNETM